MRLGREVHLVSRPRGRFPAAGDTRIVEVPVPEPGPGQVVVRNLFMSIDPGLVLRTNDLSRLDIPDFTPGEPMWSDAIGEVVESADERLGPGDIVWHRFGFRDYAVAQAGEFRRVDPDAYPSLTHHLCFGLTAYVGTEVAQIRAGDTFFVSSAAGAVGSMAGQLARLRGATRVIGSAGTPEKVRYLKERLGFDDAFDYHQDVRPRLPELDVFYDNVGGAQLEAAIDAMRPRGRIVMGGRNEEIRTGVVQGPRNMMAVIGKRLELLGYYTFDHPELFPVFDERFPRWVRSGEIVVAETIVDGLENGVDAAVNLMHGAYVGKVVLRL
ncbi:NADP-dependent oxidoreductase [Streptomyces kaniharaensis]|uniref:NADP-dependent oxidoreductase n=1 Tax=Streptomyces kaniharaensis TaxID=212423 RepID=UPI002DDCE286|nr:NADP-dependent oxidoreductase [Streptomyces kaniharaensis]